MNDEIVLNGIVLYTTLVGDYDKRLVILTKERGKITAFANNARRPKSILRAASQSFVMGKFTVMAGREAYNLIRVEVTDYFSDIAMDMEKMCYASYFSELMSYYTREGEFCTDNLNLLYFTLKALIKGDMPDRLIKSIYEIRLMNIEGQGIHCFSCVKCRKNHELVYFDAFSGGLLCGECGKRYRITKKVGNTLVYALQFIESTPVNRLFSFRLEPETEEELFRISDRFRCEYIDKNFKSLEILNTLS